MIFLTVGTHEPFDRLVQAVDDWCAATPGHPEVFGQITARADQNRLPRHFEYVERLTPVEFGARFARASLIVSHAGMGTIISALQAGKPIVVMPRRGHLGETRNDHQFATANKLAGRPGIHVAQDETRLVETIDAALSQISDANAPQISEFADAGFTSALREFIFASETRR
ncbi:glycosyltransferase [Arenibacterium sp. CAU 1754]